LEAFVKSAAREHDGTIRFSDGDAYLLTFPEASQAVTAAEQLLAAWGAARAEDRSDCGIHLLLHRGTINVFRSILWGDGSDEAYRVMATSKQCLTKDESGLFITTPVRDALAGGPWHKQLRRSAACRRLDLNSIGSMQLVSGAAETDIAVGQGQAVRCGDARQQASRRIAGAKLRSSFSQRSCATSP
jgi:class 3 adenylate cyclase